MQPGYRLTDPAGTTTYTWDARDQLAALTGPGLSASFQYDAVGRRRSKTLNGTPTAFLYDEVNLVQELMNGVPTANLLTGLGVDEVFSRTDAAGARWLLTDAVGSVLALSGAAGPVTEYTYEPFGQTTVTGAASSNPFQYTGRRMMGWGCIVTGRGTIIPPCSGLSARIRLGLEGGLLICMRMSSMIQLIWLIRLDASLSRALSPQFA